MPELPEVEVVRRGIEAHVVGHTVGLVEVIDDRSLKRHPAGSRDFTARLTGVTFTQACRRGKYLWLPFADDAVVVHLGMSGQCLIADVGSERQRHTKIVMTLENGTELRFVDQRIFGGMAIDSLVDAVPRSVAHIARDPFDDAFDAKATARRIRTKRSGVKRVLLDQRTISGVGNIYADEALWRSKLHYDAAAASLSQPKAQELVRNVTEVMSEALAAGGTSFDSLYVNVNGASGYFSRDLAAYGCEGEPCARCGTLIVREPFMNRSSYRCPRCQRRPR